MVNLSLSLLINLFIFILSFLFISVFFAVISLSFSDPAFLSFHSDIFQLLSSTSFFLFFFYSPFYISYLIQVIFPVNHFTCIFILHAYSFSLSHSFSQLPYIHIHYLHTSSFIYPVTYRFDPIFSAILNNGYMDIEE